jgi:hypothetical protein
LEFTPASIYYAEIGTVGQFKKNVEILVNPQGLKPIIAN